MVFNASGRYALRKWSSASVVLVCLTQSAVAASDVQCALPVDFANSPPPDIETAMLVDHTEEIIIDRPLDVVLAQGNRTPIEKTMRGTSTLPGVAGTHLLRGAWPEPGALRVACLTDGGSTQEQVIDNARSGNTHHFRYEVWNYTTPQARPVAYAVGDFLETDLGDGRTRIHWTYAFRLRPDQFPGYLGPLGRMLFRKFYLDTRYAELMRGALAVRKAAAEQEPAPKNIPASSGKG
jgi:hypothetical protein